MNKKNIKNYWNIFYKKKLIFKESSFARFTYNNIPKLKKRKIIDIGCGNGRDSFFFNKKGFDVLGIDISKTAIKENNLMSNKELSFLYFDVEKDTMFKKFDIIYSRFFIHALSENGEDNFIKLINKIKKRGTLIFLEFRNSNDSIFDKFKDKKHNDFINFGNGHYRRFLDTSKFIEKFSKKTKSRNIYLRSSKNLSIVKKDNPNLSRAIFRF
jgi:SAM-dependent methyltransferase